MEIIGRTDELAKLKKYYKSGRAEFIAIYGRRRVGKTFMVNTHFKNDFIFSATGIIGGKKAEELESFYTSLKDYGYTKKTPKTWMEAFNALKELLSEKMVKGKRAVIFIDELPCLATPKSGLVKALDHFWNSWASKQQEIMLIVCGSATSWIVRNIINDKGGLHNRITHDIHLFPFKLKETKEYLSKNRFKWSDLTVLQCYMILGGIPYYLSLLDNDKSLAENIDDLFFGPSAILKTEYKRLYKSLFSNPERYMSVVKELAKNKKGLTRKELAEKLKIANNGHFSDVLDDLVNCDFIRHYNIIDKSVKANGGIYQLVDFYSLFYSDFLTKKTTDAHYWSHTLNTPTQNNWFGLAYERVAMAHIPEILAALGVDRILTEYYSWRSKDSLKGAQIDLIIDRADNMINLCEIKYSKGDLLIQKDEYEKICNRVDAFQNETGTRKGIFVTLITVSGVKENSYSDVANNVICLDDMLR
jgi:AAA+ ATPase superfamily predicted ATPase